MRIIGGSLRGRRFDPPMKNWKTRPTTDFAKEALFNILENQFDFPSVSALDLFAGTGNISLELVSRGCPMVTLVEKFAPAIRFVANISKELGIYDHLELVKSDVRQFLQSNTRSFDLIFADPPYDLPWLKELPDLILNAASSKEGTIVVIEHPSTISFSEHPGFYEERKYGQSVFSFFEKK